MSWSTQLIIHCIWWPLNKMELDQDHGPTSTVFRSDILESLFEIWNCYFSSTFLTRTSCRQHIPLTQSKPWPFLSQNPLFTFGWISWLAFQGCWRTNHFFYFYILVSEATNINFKFVMTRIKIFNEGSLYFVLVHYHQTTNKQIVWCCIYQ